MLSLDELQIEFIEIALEFLVFLKNNKFLILKLFNPIPQLFSIILQDPTLQLHVFLRRDAFQLQEFTFQLRHLLD
jgi:hypothetical protein